MTTASTTASTTGLTGEINGIDTTALRTAITEISADPPL